MTARSRDITHRACCGTIPSHVGCVRSGVRILLRPILKTSGDRCAGRASRDRQRPAAPATGAPRSRRSLSYAPLSVQRGGPSLNGLNTAAGRLVWLFVNDEPSEQCPNNCSRLRSVIVDWKWLSPGMVGIPFAEVKVPGSMCLRKWMSTHHSHGAGAHVNGGILVE